MSTVRTSNFGPITGNTAAVVDPSTPTSGIARLNPLVSYAAVASTSGTFIDFTGIPSWARRVTVMFSGASSSGGSYWQIQLYATTLVTTGYNSICTSTVAAALATQAITSGFNINVPSAADITSGIVIITNVTGNQWAYQSSLGSQSTNRNNTGGGGISLASALTGLRITTVNGTDTFDAGTVNVMYE